MNYVNIRTADGHLKGQQQQPKIVHKCARETEAQK